MCICFPYPPEQVPCNTVCCWLSGAVQVVGLVVEETQGHSYFRDTRVRHSWHHRQHPPIFPSAARSAEVRPQNMRPLCASKINHAKLCDLRQQVPQRESYQLGQWMARWGTHPGTSPRSSSQQHVSASCHANHVPLHVRVASRRILNDETTPS